jgi:hypothetical protein
MVLVKVTVAADSMASIGLKVTVTSWVPPARRGNGVGVEMLNGGATLAVTEREAVLVFWTVKLRLLELPT